MRHVRILCCIVMVTLAWGCAAPTQEERALAATEQRAAIEVIEQFAEGIRTDRPEQVTSLIAPNLPPADRAWLEAMAQDAMLLAFYSGYEVDAEAAVQGPDVEEWLSGFVDLVVPGRNVFGEQIPEKLRLVEVDGDWYISWMDLAQPVTGMVVEPGDKVRKEVAEVSSVVLELLKKGRFGKLFVMIPEGLATQFVETNPGFWARLGGKNPTRIPLVRVIEDVFVPLEVTRWPDPLEDMTLLYKSTSGLIALYEMPYVWPDGVADDEPLQLEVHVYHPPDGWKLQTLRFYGSAFETLDIRRDN